MHEVAEVENNGKYYIYSEKIVALFMAYVFAILLNCAWHLTSIALFLLLEITIIYTRVMHDAFDTLPIIFSNILLMIHVYTVYNKEKSEKL